MTTVSRDWVTKLGFDGSEIDKGLQNTESRIKQLNRSFNLDKSFASLNSQMASLNALAKMQARQEEALHRSKMKNISEEERVRRKARNASSGSTRLTRGEDGFKPSAGALRSVDSRVEMSTFRAQRMVDALEGRGKKDTQSREVINGLKREMQSLQSIQRRLRNSAKMTRQEYEALQDSLKKTTNAVAKYNTTGRTQLNIFSKQEIAANSLKGSLKNLARGWLSVFAVIGAVGAGFNVVRELEAVNASLLQSTSSAKLAAQEFKFISEVSRSLGTELTTSAKGYQQISTAAKAANMTTEQTRNIFMAASEAAIAFGLSTDDQSGVMRAFTQMLGKGTVQAEEIRGQLGDRLPGAVQTAAKAIGATVPEFNKMLEQGQIISSDFLPKFTEELRNSIRETGSLEAGVNTINAAMGRLSTEMKLSIFGEEGSEMNRDMVTFLNTITDLLVTLRPVIHIITKSLTIFVQVLGVGVNLLKNLIELLQLDHFFDIAGQGFSKFSDSLSNFAGGDSERVKILNENAVRGVDRVQAGTVINNDNRVNHVDLGIHTTADAQETRRTITSAFDI